MTKNDYHLGPDGRRFSAWASLDTETRNLFIAQAFVFFPEVLGSSMHKYQRFAEWLASRHGVLCANVRDVFGAGGRKNVSLAGYTIRSAPKILTTLHSNTSRVRAILAQVSESELAGYYQVKPEQIHRIGVLSAWVGNASLALEETMEGHPDIAKLRTVLKIVAGLSV